MEFFFSILSSLIKFMDVRKTGTGRQKNNNKIEIEVYYMQERLGCRECHRKGKFQAYFIKRNEREMDEKRDLDQNQALDFRA